MLAIFIVVIFIAFEVLVIGFILKHIISLFDALAEMIDDQVISTPRLRPELLRFAQLMEAELCKNEFRGGWKDKPLIALLDKMLAESANLHSAYLRGVRDDIIEEAINLANTTMMMTGNVLDN